MIFREASLRRGDFLFVRGQLGRRKNPDGEEVNTRDGLHGAFICRVVNDGWTWKTDLVFQRPGGPGFDPDKVQL